MENEMKLFSHPVVTWIRVQDIMAMIYLYPLRWLSHFLPVSLLPWVVERLSYLYTRIRVDQIGSIRRCMANAFKHHELPTSPEVLAKAFLARDLRKSIDDLIIPRLSTEDLNKCATVQGIEFLDTALARGKGVIVVSGHFHANRLGKYYLRRMGYPIMSVRNRILKSSAMGKLGNSFVLPAYANFLSTVIVDEVFTQNTGIGTILLRRLRENGIINIHLDASYSKETIPLQFLNEQRQFPAGFLKLAELTGSPVVPMRCLGNSSTFKIHFEKPMYNTGKSSPTIFRNRLESLSTLLESWVLAHPEEWELWSRRANITPKQ